MKRRAFIKTATGASLLIPNILTACENQKTIQTVSANADAMDEALQMMSDIAPLGNHAPMAVEKVPLLPTEKRLGGSIMNQLKGLENFPDFAETINLISTDGTPEQLISELTATFSTVYLKKVSDRNNLILLHAVTAASGLRSLLPYLSSATTMKTFIYGWQTAAGLYSIGATGSNNKNSSDKEIKKDNLIDRAVNSNEEHAIKFTEACLREYALNPKPIYLQAANEGLERLPNFA